jgi:hypothetical protein
MNKPQQYTQYFSADAGNWSALTSKTVINRATLASNLRDMRNSKRWHINRYKDGGYCISSRSTGWVFSIDPIEG